MSCGCGGAGGSPKYPAKIMLRMEAARLALNAKPGMDQQEFHASASAVLSFITDNIDLTTLDAKPEGPVATGKGPNAVIVRNALLNTPLTATAIPPYVRDKATPKMLGTLAQWLTSDVIAAGGDVDQFEQALGVYGLRLGMRTDDLRHWIQHGPVETF